MTSNAGYQGPSIPDTPVAPLPESSVQGIPTSTNQGQTIGAGQDNVSPKFPDPASVARLQRYKTNDLLWDAQHVDAFLGLGKHLQLKDPNLKYRWITANFAGLVSKVAADLLFGEPVTFKMPTADDDDDPAKPEQSDDAKIGEDESGATVTPGNIDVDDPRQNFIDELVHQNQLVTQCYESALGNSRHGDAVFKIRIGYLEPGDTKTTVIIEDINPAIYFPELDVNNARAKPAKKTLAWIVTGTDGKKYLRKEIHTPGLITNEAWLMEGDLIKKKADLSVLGIQDLEDYQETRVNKTLVVHVPNWRDGSRYFGYDDYSDIVSIMFALDNRLTRMDQTLDKHANPILTVPEGVLDESGNVRRQDLEMFEIPANIGGAGQTPGPQYITWDASLDAAYKQIDKLVEMLYLFSEVTPDVFGMGTGEVTGRALRLKLLRTVAKISRKRNYYDHALKEVLYTAQLLAQAHSVGVGAKRDIMFEGDPEVPAIEWQDGLPIDSYEAAQEEALRLESGTTSQKAAIMRLDGVDEPTALEVIEEIKAEENAPIPSIGTTVAFASGAKVNTPLELATGTPGDTAAEAPTSGAKPAAKPTGR
jgi:hypothetical protein